MTITKYGSLARIILQGTTQCNLNCSYCYLSEEARKQNTFMSLDTLEMVFSNVFRSSIPYRDNTLTVVWHEGEPLTLPIDYYRQAWRMLDRLKDKFMPADFSLNHSIQTNGALLNQEWCDFFNQYASRITFGVSCDGPAFLHDYHRKNWGNQGSHAKVAEGIELLIKNKLTYGIFATITAETLNHPDAFFDFFYQYRHSMAKFITNFVVEFSKKEFAYGKEVEEKYSLFLKRILARTKTAPESFRFDLLADFYARLYSLPTSENLHTVREDKTPLRELNIDAQGRVSFFNATLGLVEGTPSNLYGDNNGFWIGSLKDQTFDEMVQSEKFQRISLDFSKSINACQSSCDYFAFCGGGDPITKYRVHGTFSATETPECRMQVKIPSDVLLEDLNNHLIATKAVISEDEPQLLTV